MKISAQPAAGIGSIPQEVAMFTPHARDAAASGPVANQIARRWVPAIQDMHVPISAGTIAHDSHGTVPVRGYSPRVTAASVAMAAPASPATISRFTG